MFQRAMRPLWTQWNRFEANKLPSLRSCEITKRTQGLLPSRETTKRTQGPLDSRLLRERFDIQPMFAPAWATEGMLSSDVMENIGEMSRQWDVNGCVAIR
jgi:hypothetical protein